MKFKRIVINQAKNGYIIEIYSAIDRSETFVVEGTTSTLLSLLAEVFAIDEEFIEQESQARSDEQSAKLK